MIFSEKILFIRDLPLEQKFWLISLFFGSLICWFAVRVLPNLTLAKNMGHQYLHNLQLSVLVDEQQVIKASRMGKLMHSISKNVPWESACLTEALCVKWLLNRYSIPAVFYLGARIDGNIDSLEAHAWLTVGPYVVTGAPEHLNYRVTATFVSPKVTE